MAEGSFGRWLVREVTSVLGRKGSPPPFIVWCDPEHAWIELLRRAAAEGAFELWSDDAPELQVRERFFREPRAPRVVWLPIAREQISWFKVFELEASLVWDKCLIDALRDYGVSLPCDQELELRPLLPTYAREWFDRPKSAWRDLTPGAAKGALVDDQRVLEVLAGEEGEFDRIREEERFSIFARRVVDDFGLPDPGGMDEDAWRVAATARLLCTEAADANPDAPPSEGERIIPAGVRRQRSLRILRIWQENVRYMPSFERVAKDADGTIGLVFWARNLPEPPRSTASAAVEEALFKKISSSLDKIEDVDAMAKELVKLMPSFRERESGFWSQYASKKVHWHNLLRLADAAELIVENAGIGSDWTSTSDAIDWYCRKGWALDEAGESLFEESPDIQPPLRRIRDRLRKGYLRAMDRAGRNFSELLANDGTEALGLPTAGELVLMELERSKKVPTAIVFLDACRFDLGQRLARSLNAGEPATRAETAAAIAPVPTITLLGMAFALPMDRSKLSVEHDGKDFHVRAEGFRGDLTVAEQRRKWMASAAGAKEFLTITEVIDGEKLRRAPKLPRLLVVQGDEFDTAGHDGELKLTGASEAIERYARAVRLLRDAGYGRVIVTTDHGFFHWQPEPDEVEEEKPKGDVLWLSRRAVVGRRMAHPSAVKLNVPCSDLEVMVPRSVNAFKTYGGLGFFHKGATLQEMVIPVVVVRWPARSVKVPVVLKPVGHIMTVAPCVQVEAGVAGQQKLVGTDDTLLARRVIAKVHDPAGVRLVFKGECPVTVEPSSGPITIQMKRVDSDAVLPYGTKLSVRIYDADDETPLAEEEVELKVDLDEW